MESRGEKVSLPYITIFLVVVNVLFFIVLYAVSALNSNASLIQYGASIPPYDIQGDYYRLITSAFMHFDLTHLANNMIMLYFVGGYVEEALGRWKYFVSFLICAVGGNLVSNLFYMFSGKTIIAMGASGAVFGMAGILAYIVIRSRGRFKDIPIQRVLIFLALSIYSGVSNSGVNNAAHIGGLITGVLMAAVFYRVKIEDKWTEKTDYENRT